MVISSITIALLIPTRFRVFLHFPQNSSTGFFEAVDGELAEGFVELDADRSNLRSPACQQRCSGSIE
jgi:hypothetical protein